MKRIINKINLHLILSYKYQIANLIFSNFNNDYYYLIKITHQLSICLLNNVLIFFNQNSISLEFVKKIVLKKSDEKNIM